MPTVSKRSLSNNASMRINESRLIQTMKYVFSQQEEKMSAVWQFFDLRKAMCQLAEWHSLDPARSRMIPEVRQQRK